VELKEGIHDDIAIPRAAEDLIKALDDRSYTPLLNAANALRTSEVIFATFESSRSRGRVDLPLQPQDSALLAMLEARQIGPDRVSG